MQRRIHNRMISVGIASLDAYLDMLRENAGEARRLLERITIKVSRFYRNRTTFDELRRVVFPALARRGEPLRLWSIGCGCGEEAYTLAMLLEDSGAPGIVHASDIDVVALARACDAVYPEEALTELPADLAVRHLEALPTRGAALYGVCETVRRRVVFGTHDVTANDGLPGGELFHLVACRNLVIYLKRGVQEEAFQRMRRALAPGGYLCLGEAEWPPESLHRSLDVVARKARIFRAATEGCV